jgi:hypothetical protein
MIKHKFNRQTLKAIEICCKVANFTGLIKEDKNKLTEVYCNMAESLLEEMDSHASLANNQTIKDLSDWDSCWKYLSHYIYCFKHNKKLHF